MSKKADNVTAQKKIDKVSAQVVREANNRILTAGSVLSQGGRRVIYQDGSTGRYINATTVSPRKTHVIDVTGVKRPLHVIDVTGVKRPYIDVNIGASIDVFTIPLTLKSRNGTVISKDSVQRAAKSAMSQFRSKKK